MLPLLRASAAVELASLVILLVNLATVHWPQVASLAGPVHGCAYLFVVVAGLRLPGLRPWRRALALVPGIGGLLLLRVR